MATRYGFRTNEDDEEFRFFKDAPDAQVIGEHIDALIDEHKGYFTYEELLKDARSHTSPLRNCFTWENEKAAEKYRHVEAKRLIGQLVLKKGTKSTRTPAFVFVHHPEHGGKRVLISTRSAMLQSGFKEEVVENATKALLRSLNRWTTSYGGANRELSRIAKDVKALKNRVQARLTADI